MVLNRTIQAFLKTDTEVEYLNPKCIDNFTKIERIICDKTGTLTKNELLLTHFSYKSNIYNDFSSIKIPFQFIYKIVLGLHHQNRIFSTSEDQIISEKLLSIGTCLELNGNNIIINRNYESKYIKLIEMHKLEFDCVRKKSSVIFYEPDKKDYYIVTKGSVDAIYSILNKDSAEEFNLVLKQYNEKYPFLRTIAFSIKKIDYNENHNPLDYETEGEYNFLTLLGIQDELQKGCVSTMHVLKNNNKRISICTGDRYETALYIANELNLLGNIQTFNAAASLSNISEKTFIFNSCDLQLAKSNYDLMTYFSYSILHSKNFIAYSSRLKKLNRNEKTKLIKIVKVLKKYKKDLILKKQIYNFSKIKKKIISIGAKNVDYIKLIDLKTLKKPKKNKFNLFYAFYIGNVRLIDNF